jgi:hypothetical protein
MYLRTNPLNTNSPLSLTISYSNDEQTLEVEYFFTGELSKPAFPVSTCTAACQQADLPNIPRISSVFGAMAHFRSPQSSA